MLKKLQINIIKVIDFFYHLIPFVRKIMPRELFTYGFTGGMNLLFDYFLFFIFYNYVYCQQNVNIYFYVLKAHNATNITTIFITFFTGFLLQKYITFTASYLNGRTQLFRYAIQVIGSIILSILLVDFFTDIVGLWGTVSKIISGILGVVYSFCMQKFFTFKIRKTDTQ
jgi:putative flippase GtrA